MRTAITVHLIGGKWTCTAGPADVPCENGVPADKQRDQAQDVATWPKDSRACVLTFSDGRVKRYYRSESELLPARMAAATKRAEDKAALSKSIEEARKKAEAKAAEESAKAAAEQNAKFIAEKEALKAKLRAEREAAPTVRLDKQPKTTTK